MASVIQLPSASNTAGTVLGGLAGAAIVGIAPSWPFVIAAAATIGMTPVGVAALLGLVATSIVNFGVSHVAEVKNLNDLVSDYWPQVEQSYPTGRNGQSDSDKPSISLASENTNINNG